MLRHSTLMKRHSLDPAPLGVHFGAVETRQPGGAAPLYGRAVPARLPLFPLGSVLLPGLLLPLHVFEERYRQLVQDLRVLPEAERRFGVVAIRQGREVGSEGVRDLTALHAVGTVARVRGIRAYDDGRFGLVAVGAERFRLTGLTQGRPYLTGKVEWLPDEPGPPGETALHATAVRLAFQRYLDALGTATGDGVEPPDLPNDALRLSYAVAAAVVVDLDDRQRLLAAPDVVRRLNAELALLRREAALLRALNATPAPELARGPASPN
jgi:Lon protease-like protein